MSNARTIDGIHALKNGNIAEGRATLMQALSAGEPAAPIWYSLAMAADSADERRIYLQKALEADPLYEDARQALAEPQPTPSTVPSPVPSAPPARQLLEAEIARRTQDGWQVVSQTDTAVQFRRPRRWNTVGLVLFVLLPLLGGCLFAPLWGVMAIGLIVVLLDYLLKKDGVAYVTADQLA
jgi:hypothetical protein